MEEVVFPLQTTLVNLSRLQVTTMEEALLLRSQQLHPIPTCQTIQMQRQRHQYHQQ
jgi:hypothetical protein